MRVDSIQEAIRDAGLDGWLFFDHHRRDPLAYRILRIPSEVMPTRRWYYFIPAKGEPRKLVHRIESAALDSLPGLKQAYASWQEQQSHLAALIARAGRIAMQYSPNCAIPYVSMVDAGTIELIRGTGVDIVSSADLIQRFEAVWSSQQLDLHLEAGRLVDQTRRDAFDLIRNRRQAKQALNEYEVQQFILNRFRESQLVTDHGPIVAVNENASNPHYEPTCEHYSHIQAGDVVLIDLWAKRDVPDAVYYDITWTGFCGDHVPDQIQNVFHVVKTARERAASFAVEKSAKGERFRGFEIDDIARGVITQEGYGDYFFHRTGHSLGAEVHGTGANMDNLESHDERVVLPGCCFTIEPGIYLPEFGIRSEINVFVNTDSARITGEEQKTLVPL
ncbi:MAG TPA: M24 family metallopeptidase [Bryobacteraceae bacterium]|nr:M24 family metallopeptidase [Bryobacteraceae bacterium]